MLEMSMLLVILILLIINTTILSINDYDNVTMNYKQNKAYIKQCKHGIFLLHENDNYVSRHLDVYGEWAEQELSLFLSLIKKNDIVIDAGANIGAFTIPLAKAVGQYGMIHSFEPQRIIYQRLNANIALNDLENVITYFVALGNSNNIMKVPLVDYSIQQNFARFSLLDDYNDFKQQNLYYNISMLTLDSINFYNVFTGNDCPKLIKMDVEMMEILILQGSKTMISRCKPIIYTENNCIMTSLPLIQQLYQLDYIPYWHLKSAYNHEVFTDLIEDFTNGYVDINMLCIHKSNLNEFSIHLDEDYQVMIDKPYLKQYSIYTSHMKLLEQGGSLTSCDV